MFARLSIYRLPTPPRWTYEVLAGFAYWLVFLLVLEPGNILRAQHAGHELAVDHEVLRITAASCLGAVATPLTLWLSRRFFPPQASRRPAAFLSSMATLSVLLILASCFLAAWIFEHAWLPSLADFTEMLTGNGLLVLFALFALCALDHVAKPVRKPEATAAEIVRHVSVKARGRQFIVHLDTVTRIESQGNYLALHCGGSPHLIRETMAHFAGKLDPARFIRIHRGVVIALDQIVAVETFDNGDGMAELRGGIEVKVSRNYRKALLARWK